MEKIKILFHTMDRAGVNYYRSQTPAMELDKNHSDKFQIEINQNIDFNDENIIDYLKSFDIIHYHRQLFPDTAKMIEVSKILKKSGTILIMDIDDYWYLHKDHPLYSLSVEKELHKPIIENLKIADYITTTSEIFSSKIKEITKKDNVYVFENSIDPEIMNQFKNNWKPDPDGKVRIGYIAGSSHWGDIQQLEGVVNILRSDPQIKDKFKIVLAGWDTEGNTTEIRFNEEFGKELQARGMWNQPMVKAINKSKGNIDLIPNIPVELKNKYRNNVFTQNKRDIKSEESIYYEYEKILTDNHKLIDDKEYYQWLHNFERNVKYNNEKKYSRVWTQKANVYAKVLDNVDIVLAPLADNTFNSFKSNLKQVECWTRKLPLVCSDVVPYNVDGVHEHNCMLVPNKKRNAKYWAKYLKRLILDNDLRTKLGQNLYNDFNEKYNLNTVTKRRANFYEKITINKFELV